MSHTSKYVHKIKNVLTFAEAATCKGYPVRVQSGIVVKQFGSNQVECIAAVKLPGWRYEVAVTKEGEILYDHFGSEPNSFGQLGQLIQSYNEKEITRNIPFHEVESWFKECQRDGSTKLVLEYAS